VQLNIPKEWSVSPKFIPFNLNKRNRQVVYLTLRLPPNLVKYMQSIATVDNKIFDKDQVIIDYNHITKQQVLMPAEAKFIKLTINDQKNRVHHGR
jgi:DNA polymerase elongation subunit (family B)